MERKARGRPRDWHDKTDQNTIKSLDRAMAVFERLSKSGGMTLTEIAEALEQSPATVYRVLVTLEGRGLVEFDADAQIWHVGSQAFVIGARFLRRTNLVERARPILRRLMESTGETANLGREQGGQVLFLVQAETHENIRAFFPPGTLSSMHASGIGKALLAYMDAEKRATVVNQPMERFTENTITRPDLLEAELGHVRTRGFSMDMEERNLGMVCIAAPVFDHNEVAIAGVSVSGPTSRVTPEKVEAFSSAVLKASRDLSLAIGGAVP